MPEPTQKEQITSFLQITGAKDFAGAQTQIESWRDAADQGQTAQTNWQAVADLLGEKDQVAIAAKISALIQNESEFLAALGATDHATAIAKVKTLGQENAKIVPMQEAFANIRQTLKLPETATYAECVAAISDFEKRVGAEVINRAAAAGIEKPIEKKPGEAAAKTMTRTNFENLAPADRSAFLKGGGTVVDS